MEQNRLIVLLDEEISRLQQVRSILASLQTTESRVAPLLRAAQDRPEPEEDTIPKPERARTQEVVETPAPVRHVSRRGVATGQRGPRRQKQVVAPRPLDAAVPKAPVVVPRSAIVAARPAATPVPNPEAAAEASLEAWVRALKGNSAATL